MDRDLGFHTFDRQPEPGMTVQIRDQEYQVVEQGLGFIKVLESTLKARP